MKSHVLLTMRFTATATTVGEILKFWLLVATLVVMIKVAGRSSYVATGIFMVHVEKRVGHNLKFALVNWLLLISTSAPQSSNPAPVFFPLYELP